MKTVTIEQIKAASEEMNKLYSCNIPYGGHIKKDELLRILKERSEKVLHINQKLKPSKMTFNFLLSIGVRTPLEEGKVVIPSLLHQYKELIHKKEEINQQIKELKKKVILLNKTKAKDLKKVI